MATLAQAAQPAAAAVVAKTPAKKLLSRTYTALHKTTHLGIAEHILAVWERKKEFEIPRGWDQDSFIVRATGHMRAYVRKVEGYARSRLHLAATVATAPPEKAAAIFLAACTNVAEPLYHALTSSGAAHDSMEFMKLLASDAHGCATGFATRLNLVIESELMKAVVKVNILDVMLEIRIRVRGYMSSLAFEQLQREVFQCATGQEQMFFGECRIPMEVPTSDGAQPARFVRVSPRTGGLVQAPIPSHLVGREGEQFEVLISEDLAREVAAASTSATTPCAEYGHPRQPGGSGPLLPPHNLIYVLCTQVRWVDRCVCLNVMTRRK